MTNAMSPANQSTQQHRHRRAEMDSRMMGPNVEQIRASATRVVRGRIPREVRKELMAAVKAGLLGRLPKDGLKPEIFFHPDHKHGAIERQKREAAYAVSCIAKVLASPADVREAIAAAGGDVLEYALSERVARATGQEGCHD